MKIQMVFKQTSCAKTKDEYNVYFDVMYLDQIQTEFLFATVRVCIWQGKVWTMRIDRKIANRILEEESISKLMQEVMERAPVEAMEYLKIHY